MNIDRTHYMMLFTVYSLPNLILPFVGGILLDKLSVRIGLIVFGALITLGQGVFMLGGFKHSFAMMIVGRTIFGLGGENMQVGINSLISRWFAGKELALAIGITMTFTRLGNVANLSTTPSVYEEYGLGPALAIGLVLCFICILVSFVIAHIDKKSEQQTQNETFKWSDLANFDASYWLLTVSCVSIYSTVYPYLQIGSDLL